MATKSTKGKTSTQRKLTAILCADVVGYSRLMGADEESTIETLTAYRKVFTSEIKKHRGRVVDAKGDAILAEFASVVDAVKGAVEIQRGLAEKNTALSDDRRMDFRIGINLGDVIVKDDVIYGDGVNVAARLESLAEPGGICISGSAYAQVRNKLPLEFEFLGNKEVKNIAEPVPVFRVLSVPGAAAHRVIGAKRAMAGRWKRIALGLGATAVVVFMVAVLLSWNNWWPAPGPEEGALALPDKPSIAVLPFDNLSGDKEQDYFSDGITEDLISQLASQSKLFVIARNTSFTYKGKPVNVQQVGGELGVRYLLEGSVQKAGDRVRITAQLIDVKSGEHTWVQRYDRALQNLFDLQDEVTSNITLQVVKELEVKLTPDEIAQVKLKNPKSIEAWVFYARGLEIYRKFGSGTNSQARVLFENALDLDPKFEPAILGLGWTYYNRSRIGFSELKAENLRKAEALVIRAIALNDTLGEPYALLGQIALERRDHDRAIEYGKRAVALNPNGAEWFAYLANSLSLAGKSGEALAAMRKALRLNPLPQDETLDVYGRILYQQRRYEEAITLYEGLLERHPNWFVSALFLIASSSAAGKPEGKRLVEKYPQTRFPAIIIEDRLAFKHQADAQGMLADLAKAGLE